MQIDTKFTMPHLRLIEHGVHGVDRATRNSGLFEPVNPLSGIVPGE